MGVYRVENVLRFHAHSCRKSGLCDDLTCVWRDDESSNDYSIFFKDLEDSLCIAQTIRLCACSERKFSTSSLQLSNESNFWIRKDACWYGSVIHFTFFSHYVLCSHFALF